MSISNSIYKGPENGGSQMLTLKFDIPAGST